MQLLQQQMPTHLLICQKSSELTQICTKILAT